MLGMNHKLPDKHVRVLYLKEVWGIPQALIGECEELKQSSISRIIKEAKIKCNIQDIRLLSLQDFDSDDIKKLQSLPREILTDIQLISFVQNILGMNVLHPFYEYFYGGHKIRITALAALGIQQVHLEKLFNKSQSTISTMVKNTNEKDIKQERDMRYNITESLKIVPRENPNPFIVVSGSQYINRIN